MKSKKLFFLLSILLSMAGTKVFAHDIEVKNADGVTIYYNYIIDNELSVTYRGEKPNSYHDEYRDNVVIPSDVEYDGKSYRVTSIGSYAFEYCPITSITIPSSVTSIGSFAFDGCFLKSIVIPNSVTTIGSYAFSECDGISSVVIGSGVKEIGSGIFSITFNSHNRRKVTWLPNKPPSGYKNVDGIVNYVPNEEYNFNNQIVYDNLKSSFEFDGIRYVPVNLSECDAIDCVYDESSSKTIIHKKVDYNGVEMNVRAVQPYICCGNGYIKTLYYELDGVIPTSAFRGCTGVSLLKLGSINEVEDNSSGCYISPKISKICEFVFYGCRNIKNVIFEDSESELDFGSGNFADTYSLINLDSIYIGRKINYDKSGTSGYSAFYRNPYLRTVVVAGKANEIHEKEFSGCTNLQNVFIGDMITTIDDEAFSGCKNLNLLALGSQIQTIGKETFSGCTSMSAINCKAITPPICGEKALSDIKKGKCYLYVPKGSLSYYKKADQWKSFTYIKERDMSQGSDNPESYKCKKPTIEYHHGNLFFYCDTEDAVCQYTITDDDIKTDRSNDVQLCLTYNISVYATKSGYTNSEIVTATLCWIDADPKTEGISNGVASVRAMPVMIQSQGGILNITGAPEGSVINVYDLSGKMVESAISDSETTCIPTNLNRGEIGIVKIGDKTIKVVMQ